MAMMMTCDGCDGPIPLDTTGTGHLVKVFYCPDCVKHFVEMEQAIASLREMAVALFESGWSEARAQARSKLKKLPDE